MKKVFNLSVILAVLAATFSFTSCSEDSEDAAAVNIKVETTTTGAIVTISSDEDLTAVELWQNGSKKSNIDVKSGSNKGKATSNVYTLTELENGAKYSIKAETATGASEKEFTVGGNGGNNGSEDILCNLDEASVKAGDVIFYEHNGQQGQLQVISADAAAIKFSFNGLSEIELSDAGKSYLSINGSAIGLADAKAAGEIIVAKVANKAMLAGGASSELNTKFTKNATKLGK